MPWREAMRPVRMQRVAVLAPDAVLRPVLALVADEGSVDFDDQPAVAVSVDERATNAVTQGSVAGLAGWLPETGIEPLARRVNAAGGAVVPLPRPTFADPPTLLTQRGTARDFAPLVQTYATPPYADVNPAVLAGLAYVAMFGMMFADAGHGALLVVLALAARRQSWAPLQRLRPVWLFLLGAGLASVFFGLLYGEFFGPTGALPVLWMAPLDRPIPLLGVAVGIGAVLLAGAYALGSVNRFREGGWQAALYAPSGIAGSALFFGVAAAAGGAYLRSPWLVVLGAVTAALGLVLAFVGLYAAAGRGGAAVLEAGVESFDLVLRLGSNLVSFARLAAFGLTHAALGSVVWDATTALAGRGAAGITAAVLVFAVGNAVTFGLEGLVAGIQALRLEYYELFSRIFDSEGRPYRPWHVPLATGEAACSPG